MTYSIQISDAAAERVTYLIKNEASEKPLMLRVSVSGGGCSGFQYAFSLDDTIMPEDHVFSDKGISVVIDETSLPLINQSLIDYINDLSASMFVIKNPNASSSCGCGNSFSI
jgi:iron-sulfur cluster insertion protein